MLAANEDVPPDVGWLLPAFEAGRGHPILLKSRALDAIRGAPLDASLRDVLALSGWSRQEVPVPDAGIHVNVDTESDWAKALAWWRRETGEC
jgi:molybdenum cofactor cytidylyltransferase